MSHRNADLASGCEIVTAGATAKNYIALQVIGTGDVTFETAMGDTVALTAAAAGLFIPCKIVKVTVNTGVVLGYKA